MAKVNFYGSNLNWDRYEDAEVFFFTGGPGSYIIFNEEFNFDVSVVTPNQIVYKDEGSSLPTVVNYSQLEKLTIVGTADGLDDSLAWTTGGTTDEIIVQGTRGERPITVSTGGGNDVIKLNGLVGNESAVFAGDGNDYVYGSSRADILSGGAGEDHIEGGDGDDVLIGGLGWDSMLGGFGSDVFKYTSVQDSPPGTIDTIGDFVRGVDKIDLSAIGSFHWITGPFTGAPGEVRGTMLGIQVDANGDKLPDMIIFVNTSNGGGWTMSGSDFIF